MAEIQMPKPKGLDQSPARLARRAEAAKLLDARSVFVGSSTSPEQKNEAFAKLKDRAREAGKKAEDLQAQDQFPSLIDKIKAAADEHLLNGDKIVIQHSAAFLAEKYHKLQGIITANKRAAAMAGTEPRPIDRSDRSAMYNTNIHSDRDDRLTPDGKRALYRHLGVLPPDGELTDLDALPERSSYGNIPDAYKTTRVAAIDYYIRMKDNPGVSCLISRTTDSSIWSTSLSVTDEVIDHVQPGK